MIEDAPHPALPFNPLHAVLDKGLLKQCVHCGLCLDACPTYRLLGHEADSPRGRIFQVRQVYEGRISPDDRDFRTHIYACLDCRACQTACPSGVQYGQIVEAARAVAEPPRPAERTVARLVLGTVFTRKPLLEVLGFGARLYQRSGLQALVRRSGLLDAALPALGMIERQLAPVHGSLVRRPLPTVQPAIGARRLRVGLIEGCVMPQLFSDTNWATIRVLAVNGCEVVVPPAQGCCGALHAHTGDPDSARALARRNVDAFEPLDLDVIAVNAAGCGSALKEYGHLLAGDPAYAARAAAFAARVRDVSEVLASLDLLPPTQAVPLTVTYQDACHLAHGQGVRLQPRKVLGSIPGLKLVEMQESDTCCGSAGIYNLTHPDIAEPILKAKMQSIRATGAHTVVASNPGCSMQIAAGAQRYGPEDLQVVHVVELLDRAYGGAAAWRRARQRQTKRDANAP
ncbi:MAG: 4Fe-4S dicluster domain-containing protein [Chloroflexi bacterium]|nr:4Fe-4S dicluster domain-containing protein [Chloroflexota bacterium]